MVCFSLIVVLFVSIVMLCCFCWRRLFCFLAFLVCLLDICSGVLIVIGFIFMVMHLIYY